MKFLLFCCLFGTFLATGMCLDCEQCVMWGQNCTGWRETCENNEDTCVTYQTEVIGAPLSITFTAKACGTSDTCHLDYVETNLHNELTVRAKRTCCTRDECQTLPRPVLEPQVHRPNGLQCPGCIGLSSTECNEYLVSCQGSENQCMTVTGKNHGLPLSHPNGYICPGILGLFSEDSTEYEASCKGDETKCINFVGYRKERFPVEIAYNIKGCVSSCPELRLSNRMHEEHRNGLLKVECRDAVKITPSE